MQHSTRAQAEGLEARLQLLGEDLCAAACLVRVSEGFLRVHRSCVSLSVASVCVFSLDKSVADCGQTC